MNNDCNKVFQDNAIIEFELICLNKKAWVCRKKSKEAETQIEFQLERNTKGNMK